MTKASTRARRKFRPALVISVMATAPPTAAKAPWARFAKRISPMVTDRPTEMRNSTIP